MQLQRAPRDEPLALGAARRLDAAADEGWSVRTQFAPVRFPAVRVEQMANRTVCGTYGETSSSRTSSQPNPPRCCGLWGAARRYFAWSAIGRLVRTAASSPGHQLALVRPSGRSEGEQPGAFDDLDVLWPGDLVASGAPERQSQLLPAARVPRASLRAP